MHVAPMHAFKYTHMHARKHAPLHLHTNMEFTRLIWKEGQELFKTGIIGPTEKTVRHSNS